MATGARRTLRRMNGAFIAWWPVVELLEPIANRFHGRFVGREDVPAALGNELAGNAAQRNVDELSRSIRHLRTALSAEWALERRRGTEMHDGIFTFREVEIGPIEGRDRAAKCAVMLAAHSAMTMRHPLRGPIDFELHC